MDAETGDRAQLTLACNRIARPDIVKRPYLLRGLMKCKHCGMTFVGTTSWGKLESPQTYYMWNGRKRKTVLNCPSSHIRARELEALAWEEIEGFLNQPEKFIDELEMLLRQRLSEGVGDSELFKELEELRADAAGKKAETNALYRLLCKGMLPETDLESQLGELREEKATMLEDMREKVHESDSWCSRRRVVENLVAGIELETHPKAAKEPSRGRSKVVTLRIRYRFEVPDIADVPPVPFVGRLGHVSASMRGLSIVRYRAGSTSPSTSSHKREMRRENSCEITLG